MCSTDVEPDRITVAENAAIAFIRSQAGGVLIGLVAFAGVAGLPVPPTTDTGKLISATQQLSTARGTVIGAAILTSIDGIAAVDPSVAPTGADPGATPGSATLRTSSWCSPTAPTRRAPYRKPPPPRPLREVFAFSPSGSAPPPRRGWPARAHRSKVVDIPVSAVTAAVAVTAAAAVGSWGSIR